jgi:hypothetical protein
MRKVKAEGRRMKLGSWEGGKIEGEKVKSCEGGPAAVGG